MLKRMVLAAVAVAFCLQGDLAYAVNAQRDNGSAGGKGGTAGADAKDRTVVSKNRTSKKEREAELDRLYDEAQAAEDAYSATITEDNPLGDMGGPTYSSMIDANVAYEQELQEAIDNKEVRGSYDARPAPQGW